MKVTTLDEIIEKNVDESLYFKKSDWEKRKYLKTTLPMLCTVDGDDVYLYVDGVKPPQILKQKRTEEEKLRRHLYGDKGKKFGKGVYLAPTGDGYSNTLTTFSMDNYVWDLTYKVRELTDLESFRLMDVDFDDANKIIAAVPKRFCRKLAGNSITVNVMTEIFRNLFYKRKENPEKSLF